MNNYDILKGYCKKIFLIGNGNFWYEESEIGDDRRFIYRAFGALLYFIYVSLTVLEIMAAIFGEFPEDEKRDSMTFALSHTIVMIKIYSIVIHKSLIKTLNHKMVTICQQYEEPELMAEKFKHMKINVIGYVAIVYGSCVFFIFEGLRKVYAGSHFTTVVTYYPSSDDDSSIAFFVRIYNTGVLCVMMLTMIVSVDSFTLVYIIMYKYKFITLRRYFECLKDEVEILHGLGQNDLATEKLANGLVEGIVMHSKVIKLSKEIAKAFGTVMAVQLCQSSGSAVSILLQIALADELNMVAAGKLVSFAIALFLLLGLFMCNAGEITYQLADDLKMVAAGKLVSFAVGLFFLLALFLCNAGEITYQVLTFRSGFLRVLLGFIVGNTTLIVVIPTASLVSDAIFYCGWQLCPPRSKKNPHRNIRPLVVLAMMQAQRPIVMKAFKMIELTYGTFLLVVRSTYSVFALFYAQNK